MKISEFVLKFKNAGKQEDQEKLVIDNIKNQYVPYQVKVAHCQMIASGTMFDDKRRVKLNTPARYMLLICVFIQDHMNLEFADIDNVAMFNALEEIGADDMICGILDSEFQKYRSVLDMCVDDLLDRERNYVDYVNTVIDKLASNISDLVVDFVKQVEDSQPKVEPEKPAPKKRMTKKKAGESNGGNN